jgi:vancomycin resistance protein YoaR
MRLSPRQQRWLPLAALCLSAGAVAAVGGGVLPLQAPDSKTAGKPSGDIQAPAKTDSVPEKQPADTEPGNATTPETPEPDPRIEPALGTKVCLQAGKAKLWTELRRLGVSLEWPEASEPQWAVNGRLFQRALRRLARRAERAPRNARLLYRKGTFTVVQARTGQRLDRDEAQRLLLAAVGETEFRRKLEAGDKLPPITISVPLRTAEPTVLPAHLGGINTRLASYSTGLGGSSRNRRHNIQLACEAIDGLVLLPGDVFSYNDVVGPRSERAGFRTAPVIIRGELVPGTGGGICQVSSTLYNAALLADLRIVRRSHHQFPVHYVPPGRDATVAYGSLDLRFANSLSHPVALDVKSVGSRVIVNVLGWGESKRVVKLVNSRVTWTRPRVPASGGRPRPGKRVTVTRVVQLADGTVRREVVSRDVYAPAPASADASRTRRRRSHRRRSSAVRRRSGSPSSSGASVRPAPAVVESSPASRI